MRKVFVLAIAILVTSCSTTNYLSHSTSSFAPVNTTNLAYVKNAIQRPNIDLAQLEDELSVEDPIVNQFQQDNIVEMMDNSINNIIIEARTYLGTPYRYGGTTRRGIDCSAFMQKAFLSEGITLPRTSSRQAKIGSPVPKDRLERGDLIFFSTTSRTRVTHVGLVTQVEDGEVYFIHASSSQGVTISSLDNSYWKSRYRTARRVANFHLPILAHADDYSNYNLDSLK